MIRVALEIYLRSFFTFSSLQKCFWGGILVHSKNDKVGEAFLAAVLLFRLFLPFYRTFEPSAERTWRKKWKSHQVLETSFPTALKMFVFIAFESAEGKLIKDVMLLSSKKLSATPPMIFLLPNWQPPRRRQLLSRRIKSTMDTDGITTWEALRFFAKMSSGINLMKAAANLPDPIVGEGSNVNRFQTRIQSSSESCLNNFSRRLQRRI